ncbi:hypothetical protein ACOB87_07455 [Streptomyces sp. YS-B37]|uniref:hypothetical protein n=1 Tax=Streptomyces sp. YS-B37 TaxID=3407669 RepID=UPI003B50DEA5
MATTVRWLLGTIDPASGGWWNTPEGRLLPVPPLSGYTVTAIMLSPWGKVTGGHINPRSPSRCGATAAPRAAMSPRTSPIN